MYPDTNSAENSIYVIDWHIVNIHMGKFVEHT